MSLSMADRDGYIWHDGKLVEQLRPGSAAQRVQDVLGDAFVSTSREVDLQIGPMRVHGRAGLPDAARSRADWQYCYVNGRYVRDKLIAHAIHYNSARAKRPFVKVSCAALPQDLIESELFGHEKGSFTGATSMKPGAFKVAPPTAMLSATNAMLPNVLTIVALSNAEKA